MNGPPDLPEPPIRRARRSRALPWVLLAVGLCLLAGIGVALVVLLAPQRPEVVVPGPVVTIRIGWEAASPEEVEQHLSMPVEERLGRVADAVALRTEARVGECLIEMEFTSGTGESAALDSVRRALDGVTLPEHAGRPEVDIPAGPGDRIVLLVLSGDATVRELLRGVDTVREKLSREPGVRRAETIGAPGEIMLVEVDDHALERFDLSPDALLTAIREGTRTAAAAGSADGGAATDLSRIVILTHGETPVYLRDIARVIVSHDIPTSAAFDETGPVMLIRVVCRAGAATSLLQGDVSGLADVLPPRVRIQARLADASDDHLLFMHWRSPAGEPAPVLQELAGALFSEDTVKEVTAWTLPGSDRRALLRTDVPARDLAPNMVGVLTRFIGIELLSHPDPAREPLTFDVFLEDRQDPAGLVEDLQKALRTLEGVEFVTPGPAPAPPELRLVVSQERAAAMGIPAASITEQVALFLAGQEVGVVGGMPVVVRIGESPRRPDDLAGRRIRTSAGEWIPLSEVASFELAPPPAVIRRVDRRRAVTLSLVPAEGADREKVLANARDAVRRRMEQDD